MNPLATANVHSIIIQIPIERLTRDGSRPGGVTDSAATVGFWTSASRQKGMVFSAAGRAGGTAGPYVQVSRLGNPLVNEVIIPLGHKDTWNTLEPSQDKEFVSYYEHPGLAELLPVLYPGVFPNLKGLTAARADLVAILLTGIPSGIIPGFQNYTGSTQADELRLNVAVPPSKKPSLLGLLGGDAAGFPNGRRVFDDVTTIALRAVAGVTYGLVNSSYKPDAAGGEIFDVVDPAKYSPDTLRRIGVDVTETFPYLESPHSGFSDPSRTP